MKGTEKWIKLGGTVLCGAFAVFTAAMLLAKGEPDRLALAFGTVLLAYLKILNLQWVLKI